MTVTITTPVADIVATVRRLAAERPANSTSCTYAVPAGRGPLAPSCIIGHALHHHGVTLAQLKELDGWKAVLPDSGGDTDIRNLLATQTLRVADLADPAWDWLATVQAEQDRGAVWRHAVLWADGIHGPIHRENP